MKKKIIYILCCIVIIELIILAIVMINRKRKIEIKNENLSNIWIGSFQLAWNELKNQIGTPIIFKNDRENSFVKELNENKFSKEMLSNDSYYVKIGKSSKTFNEEVIKDINKRFRIDNKELLEIKNDDTSIPGYTIYCVLNKKIEFLYKFDPLGGMDFKENNKKYKYFGINSSSNEELNANVEILTYEIENNEYAVKILSKEGDEVILYKTSKNDSFEKIYEDLIEKEKEYLKIINQENFKGTFANIDQIYIPYITINEIINYSQLCNKEIENANSLVIKSAYQSVNFLLNEKGANLDAYTKIKSILMSHYTEQKDLVFDDDFIMFIKEKDKEYPYFAVKIDSDKYLVECD